MPARRASARFARQRANPPTGGFAPKRNTFRPGTAPAYASWGHGLLRAGLRPYLDGMPSISTLSRIVLILLVVSAVIRILFYATG